MPDLDNLGNELNEKVEPLMPVGWADGDDIFAVDSWSGAAVAAPEEANDSATETPHGEDPAPAIEPTENAEGDTAVIEAELQKAAAPANKLRFKTQYNHQDLDVELDEADLPSVYQKSLALDRTREKLNKVSPVMDKAEKLRQTMGYDSVEAMLDSAQATFRQNEIDQLVRDGVHKAVAEDIVDRRLKSANVVIPNEPEEPVEEKAEEKAAPASEPGRNWAKEVSDLMAVRPDLRGKSLPKAVEERASKDGVSLLVSYLEYESAQNQAEIARLKKVNQTQEQNVASFLRSPVVGVTGGGATDTEPVDPFMEGFNRYF